MPRPFRRLLAPALAATAAFLLLLGLGFWQLHRLAWKQDILHRIAQAEANPPIPLPKEPGPFQRVEITGAFPPGPTALYGAQVEDTPAGPRMGGQLIVPLDRPGLPPVLVDRGWVPDPVPEDLPAASGERTITGYVLNAQKPGLFTPSADPAHRRFYVLDPAAIAAALGLQQVAPFILVAMGPDTGQPPIPAQHLPQPPNNHLQYALTWFGLAGALILVFITWARSILKDDRTQPRL